MLFLCLDNLQLKNDFLSFKSNLCHNVPCAKFLEAPSRLYYTTGPMLAPVLLPPSKFHGHGKQRLRKSSVISFEPKHGYHFDRPYSHLVHTNSPGASQTTPQVSPLMIHEILSLSHTSIRRLIFPQKALVAGRHTLRRFEFPRTRPFNHLRVMFALSAATKDEN